jgi:hypothetical protein
MFRAAVRRFLTRPVTPAQIEQVVDPDGGRWLVGVTGTITPVTVERLGLLARGLASGETLHLDLHHASIASAAVMREIEHLADRLESDGIRVRLVGVEPDHPLIDVPY